MSAKKGLLKGDAKRSIFIVDDHPIFREGLSQLVNQEDDLFVAGNSDNVADALKLIDTVNPDLVIVDLMLRDSSGIDLVQEINKRGNRIPVIVLSMHEDPIFVDRVLKAGARGYIVKRETIERVIEAVRQVLSGRIYVSENLLDSILHRFASGGRETGSSLVENLSAREFQVLSLIGQGLPNSRIAEQMNVSNKTIATYRERIKVKLNLKSASELTRYAIRLLEEEGQSQVKSGM